MSTPDLIGPPPGTTPVDLAGPRRRRRRLPDDLMREASRRLGILSLLAAGLWVVAPALDHLALQATRLDVTDLICAVSALLSVGLYFYTRKSGRSPQFILDLGL